MDEVDADGTESEEDDTDSTESDGADCTDTAETETTGMETEETESDSTETVENNDIEINMSDDSKVTEEKEIVRRTVEIKDDSDDLTFIDLK